MVSVNTSAQASGLRLTARLCELASLAGFVEACTDALVQASGVSSFFEKWKLKTEALFPAEEPSPEDFQKLKASFRAINLLAETERDLRLPYLYAFATIQIWSLLEWSIDDLVVSHVRERPDVRKHSTIQDLKGPLVSFATASPQEQSETLVDLIKSKTCAALKPGIGRFESLLDCVGLSGPVGNATRRCLLELSEVRNVLVHRQGRADSKLFERCPWLPFNPGDTLRLTRLVVLKYSLTAQAYLTTVDVRAGRLLGEPIDPDLAAIAEEVETHLLEISDEGWPIA